MSHTSNKVHHDHSNSLVPFSWENKPGERKINRVADKHEVDDQDEDQEEPMYRRRRDVATKLPPPPCESNYSRASFHDMQIPLPPCAFGVQPMLKNSSSRRSGIRKEVDDDPFLIAYKACTKSSTTRKGNYGFRKNVSLMSCKHSCSVRDDSIVSIPHISPMSKSQRERERG